MGADDALSDLGAVLPLKSLPWLRVYVGSQFLWIQPLVSWPCAFFFKQKL